MRLDRADETSPTASQILNWSSLKELEHVFQTVALISNIFIFNQFIVSTVKSDNLKTWPEL